jgi:hypothetical protein
LNLLESFASEPLLPSAQLFKGESILPFSLNICQTIDWRKKKI